MRRFAGIGKPRKNLSRFPRERGVRRPRSSRERVDQTVPSVQPPDSGGDGYGQPGDIAALTRRPRSTQAPGGAEMTGLVLENFG